MNIKLVILDMDGTTICNEWAHLQARRKIIASMGTNCTLNLHNYIGRSNHIFWSEVLNNMGLIGDVDALVYRQFADVLQIIKTAGLKESPGLKELLRFCHSTDRKTALCTGSDEWFVLEILQYLDIQDLFDVVITAKDVRNLKPAPDLYIVALQKTGIAAQNAIALEDSVSGCMAVHSAGMPCIGYLAGGTNQQELSTAEYRINCMLEAIEILRQVDLD